MEELRPCRSGFSRELFRTGRSLESSRGSEEHTAELQSLMRLSYAVFCLIMKRPPAKDTVMATRLPDSTLCRSAEQETGQALDSRLAAPVPAITLVRAGIVGAVILAVLISIYDLTSSI